MKSVLWAFLVPVFVGTAGLGLAQDQPPTPAPPKPAAARAPAQPRGTSTAPKPPKRESAFGTLVAFDTEKAMITFTDESNKTFTWAVEARLAQNANAYAQQRLQTLKEGDRVRITYVVEAGVPRVYDVKPALPTRQGSDR